MSKNAETVDARLENVVAAPRMAEVAYVLARVVEDALAPALDGRVSSCLHVLSDATDRRLLREESPVVVEQRALICPMHPDTLLCDMTKCLRHHFTHWHADDDPVARCFVCSVAISEGQVTPVWGAVQLHRAVPLFTKTKRGRCFTYAGEIWTLPVTYLCPRHVDLVELPIRMAWPSTFADATAVPS